MQQYRDDHPFFPLVISQGVWDVAAYVPDGPHKRDLDEIASIRPIVLFDNSGHSVWVNSAMLRTLGIDRDTPDVSENLSYIVRDEAGEPTGWLKEFTLTHHTGEGRAARPYPVLKWGSVSLCNGLISFGSRGRPRRTKG